MKTRGTNLAPLVGEEYLPMVFTEQGVAMLWSVLNSDRAITVNIKIEIVTESEKLS